MPVSRRGMLPFFGEVIDHNLNTTSTAPVVIGRLTGRSYLWAGLVIALISPVLYFLQLAAIQNLALPWYMPVLGTVGLGLLVLALARKFTLWRTIAVVLVTLVAGFEWYFLLSFTKLPAYSGPVTAAQAFPPFSTTLADGSVFNRDSLKGEQNSALVFFRGRW